MVCCSCTQRYEDCPNQSNDFAINPRIGTVSNNQSINLHNITKRDASFDKPTTREEEEPVQWESDSSLNTHCPPSQPFPCFCYSTSLEDATQPQNLKSPALDVHLSFDQNTQEFDVHRVHITKPSFDYDTLYCVRESEDNEEEDDSNAAHTLPTTTTTPDQEETEEENEIDSHEYDVIEEGSGLSEDIAIDSDINEDEETTTEQIKSSHVSDGYGLKAILKYKIKKVKNTWSNIKNLLWYSYDR